MEGHFFLTLIIGPLVQLSSNNEIAANELHGIWQRNFYFQTAGDPMVEGVLARPAE